MQENVTYFVQSAERRSYIGAYSPPARYRPVVSPGPGGEGGGKIVQVEEAFSEETGDGGGGRALRKPRARSPWTAMGSIRLRCERYLGK